MAKVSVIFGLSNSQAELDFVDIDTATDTPLYLDPYAIQIRDDEWSEKCGDRIRSFFNEVLDALRNNNMERAYHLLGHLHEPNETFLGQSTGRPRGRGVGTDKAEQLADALINSRAFTTGMLSDVSEAELFIRNVGPDTISDLTTNILRGPLADYTKEQCDLHGIATQQVNSLGPIWNPVRNNWEAHTLELPVYQGRPILLVPKFSVRQRTSLDSQEFWNHHMIEFLRQEYLASGSSLIHVFRDGTPHVYKNVVQERHPFIKDDLADFVRQHPQVLDMYKNLKGAKGPLEPDDLEEGFDERAFALALIDRLGHVDTGNDAASEYHSITMGICTFLFYPGLICPIKEQEIHQGRKRIDIKYTNSSETRFFSAMLQAPQTRAISVSVECKNYRQKEINNPELDQLSGRFGHQRGFFGILLCRSMDNRDRILDKCRDTVQDGRGFMLVFEDADIVEMLTMVANGQKSQIDVLLQDRFDEIVL